MVYKDEALLPAAGFGMNELALHVVVETFIKGPTPTQ